MSCLFINIGKTNFFLIKPTDALISQIYFCQETTCFGQFLCPSSGGFHCTFSTHLCHASLITALCMTRMVMFESCQSNLHDIYQCRMYSGKLLMMGMQRNCLKHVVSWQKQVWEIGVSVGFIKKKFVMMHGHMNIKLVKLTSAKCLGLMLLQFEESLNTQYIK
jgi:hypothetical protein